jgi:hypothetical protein
MGGREMKIEIIKGENNPVAKFFSAPSQTPETDDFDRNWDSYSEPWKAINLARKLEHERDIAIEKHRLAVIHWQIGVFKMQRERDEARGKYTTLLTENMLTTQNICNERDEAKERCCKLEKAMSYSSEGETLLERFLQAVKDRDEAVDGLNKISGTHLSVALSERDDALNQITGWENKWKAAVEMAAIAENKCNDLQEEVNNLQDQRDLCLKVIKRLEATKPC